MRPYRTFSAVWPNLTDIDLLIEFLPGARPTLRDMAQIETELSAPLGGRAVDLRTAGDGAGPGPRDVDPDTLHIVQAATRDGPLRRRCQITSV